MSEAGFGAEFRDGGDAADRKLRVAGRAGGGA